MSLLVTPNHELRSGWKLIAYVGFFLLILVASGLAVSEVIKRIDPAGSVSESQASFLALNAFVLFIPAVAAMWLTIKFVDHRPLHTFGVGLLPHWQEDFLSGLGVAAGMLAVLIGGCYAFGYVNIQWTGTQVPPGLLAGTFGVLLFSALNEELIFRGFPLRLLIDGIGEWPAMIGMSVLFGAMHLNNPSASALGTVNTILAGMLLSLAFVRTGSLWMPYGIHIGWNVGLGFIFGLPLSGIDLASLWTTGVAGSETMLGGDYGPEGGLLATFTFAVAAVIVQKYGSIYRTQADTGSHTRRDHRN